MNTDNTQCCYISEKSLNESDCEVSPKPLNDIKVIVDSKQFNPLYREIFGFAKYKMPEEKQIPLDIDMKAECSDGNLEFAINGEFTKEEENILKSKNHCLNYTLSSFENIIYPGVEYDCKSGLLLQTSKDAGIECADLSLFFKGGAQEFKLKTCLPMAYETYTKIKIPQYALEQLKEALKLIPIPATQVIAELSDSKGHKITFDSETGEFIGNNSIILSISKFLFLFSLF